MLRIYKNGIKGGITRVIRHYAEAANKYMNNFDLSKSFFSSFTTCLNLNNQYGNVLSEPIKYGEFEWVEDMSIFTDNFSKNYNKNCEV